MKNIHEFARFSKITWINCSLWEELTKLQNSQTRHIRKCIWRDIPFQIIFLCQSYEIKQGIHENKFEKFGTFSFEKCYLITSNLNIILPNDITWSASILPNSTGIVPFNWLFPCGEKKCHYKTIKNKRPLYFIKLQTSHTHTEWKRINIFHFAQIGMKRTSQ